MTSVDAKVKSVAAVTGEKYFYFEDIIGIDRSVKGIRCVGCVETSGKTD